MMKKLICILGLLVSMQGFAQDSSLITKPFQFTFMVPPFSTDLHRSAKYAYALSINPFMGLTGGVDGLEIGGFMNINTHYVKGIQFAGFGNIVATDVNGIQFSGFGNFVGGGLNGTQFAGFGNFNGGNSNGLMMAGFANVSAGEARGCQVAGFGNFVNGADANSQIAGFMNVSPKGVTHMQLSGFLNAADRVDGLQVAGFINKANVINGLQVAGFINICDSINGIPIAFINIVKHNHYSNFELAYSDLGNVFFSYRLGVRHFYNIYALGFVPGGFNRLTFGSGFGYEQDLGSDWLLNLEVQAHQVLWLFEGPNTFNFMYIDKLNMLNQLKCNFGMKLTDQVSIFAGPTLNVSIMGRGQGYTPYDDLSVPWAFSNYSGHTKVKTWPGFNMGIRL